MNLLIIGLMYRTFFLAEFKIDGLTIRLFKLTDGQGLMGKEIS